MSAVQMLPLYLEQNRRTGLHLFQERRKFEFVKLYVLVLWSRSPQSCLLPIAAYICTKETQKVISVFMDATFCFFFYP